MHGLPVPNSSCDLSTGATNTDRSKRKEVTATAEHSHTKTTKLYMLVLLLAWVALMWFVFLGCRLQGKHLGLCLSVHDTTQQKPRADTRSCCSSYLRSCLQRSMTAMGMLPIPSKATVMSLSRSCRLLVYCRTAIRSSPAQLAAHLAPRG